MKFRDIREKMHTIAANIFSHILLSSIFALAVYQASLFVDQDFRDLGMVQTLNKRGETASKGVTVFR